METEFLASTVIIYIKRDIATNLVLIQLLKILNYWKSVEDF